MKNKKTDDLFQELVTKLRKLSPAVKKEYELWLEGSYWSAYYVGFRKGNEGNKQDYDSGYRTGFEDGKKERK